MPSQAMASIARLLRGETPDADTSIFAPRPDMSGPRGFGGKGFGRREDLMAPMPTVKNEVMDPAIVTPELMDEWAMIRQLFPSGV